MPELMDRIKDAVFAQAAGVSLSEGDKLRVLVTGSRMWTDQLVVRTALGACAQLSQNLGGRLVVVHGAAKGADSIADRWALWATHAGWCVDRPERHPVNWRQECRPDPRCKPGHRRQDPRGWDMCPVAAFYRNEEMVHSKVSLCLAFVVDPENPRESRGTKHCLGRAKEAGIRIVQFEA